MVDSDVLLWKWGEIKKILDKLGYDTRYINTVLSKDNLQSLDETALPFVNDHILKNLETLSYGRIPYGIDTTGFAERIPEEYTKMGVTPYMVLFRFSQVIYDLNTDRFGTSWANDLSQQNREKLKKLQDALLTLAFYVEGTQNIGGFAIPQEKINDAFTTLSLFIEGYFGKGEYAGFFSDLKELAKIKNDYLFSSALNPEKLATAKIK
jgi:hypothetical protein